MPSCCVEAPCLLYVSMSHVLHSSSVTCYLQFSAHVGDILSNVFPSMQNRVDFKSFGHVVPQESVSVPFANFFLNEKSNSAVCLQVLGLVVPSGPNGHEFQFSFANRNSAQMLNDLSQALVIIAETVPDGVRNDQPAVFLFCVPNSNQVVVFFQSYAYEAQV